MAEQNQTPEEIKERLRAACNKMVAVVGLAEFERVATWVEKNPNMARNLLKNYLK